MDAATVFAFIGAAMTMQAAPPPFEIAATTVSRFENGGCEVALDFKSNYEATIQVSANAILLDEEQNTLGEAHVSFPTTLPGKKSSAAASFYYHKLAGGDCPKSFSIQITPWFCKIVGADAQIIDSLCKRSVTYTIKSKF